MSIKSTEVTRRASEVLYDELATSRNSIRRENIRLVRAACDQMERDGVQMSAAEIARRCGENGPAYSTISNSGSQLGDYVRLRITEQAARRTPVPGARRSVADGVADPVLQAQMRDLESVKRYLTRENSGLRALLKGLRPGVDIDRLLRGDAKPTEARLTGAEKALPSVDVHEVRGALLKLIDHLVGARQYKLHRGRLTINGKVVLDPGEVEALRRTTNLSDDEWGTRYGGVDTGGPRG